jgi:hypothetical protein
MDLSGAYDGYVGSVQTVYATISGIILAELFYPDEKSSYIDGKSGAINSIDYCNYKVSTDL